MALGTGIAPMRAFIEVSGVLWVTGSVLPRGSIYTTTMELGPKRPSSLWFWGPNSIIVVYMDPLGYKGFIRALVVAPDERFRGFGLEVRGWNRGSTVCRT